MGTALALALYGLLLAAAAAAVWRRPLVALSAFVVGLALHNAVMAGLYGLGVRGGPLTAIQSWKEALLAVAVARVGLDALRERRLPFRPSPVDALALAFAALVALYAVLPQSALGGQAGQRTVAYALRHDLVPVAAYLLGRSLLVSARQVRALAWTLVGAAATVAALGLLEEYTVPIEWWRGSGAVGYFHNQLGFDYHGPGGLPENFVFNTGNENHLVRRLVSVFLSPLGTGYMLVVALLLAGAGGPLCRRARLVAALALVAAAGLLFTFSRASIAALAVGLLVLAFARRRAWPVGVAAVTVAAGVGFAQVFPSVAPRTHFFKSDLAYQHEQARLHGGVPKGTLSTGEPSIRSHLASLEDGLRTLVHHPQGYGLGNAGATALRRGVPLKAGESNYTELGVETGIVGMLLFIAWNVALLAGLVHTARSARDETHRFAAGGLAGALAAVLALAVQTDAFGVPWLGYCLWLLAGTLLVPAAVRSEAIAPAHAPARAPTLERV